MAGSSLSSPYLREEISNIQANLQTMTQFSGRILVVDDEMGPRQSLRMLLNDEHEVWTAKDSASAMAILSSQDIDVVITDLRMPHHSGMELLKYIRKSYPQTEVIILTGYGQLDTAMQAVELGAFAYLEKPFDSGAMVQYIRRALARRREELERKRLEELALEANRFETLGRLVSNMVHDLGTPLSVIASNIELLMLDEGFSRHYERLNLMFSQVMHCSEIVQTTLGYLRRQPRHWAAIDVHEVIDGCIKLAEPLFRSQAITLRKDKAENVPYIRGDIVLVRQAILNLLTNACQAMEGQEGEQVIAISTWQVEGWLCISIADTGPGIPPGVREKVFQTFYSTKGSGGTGLGLTVAKNVMNQHGGHIALEENTNCGALFTLQFPLHRCS